MGKALPFNEHRTDGDVTVIYIKNNKKEILEVLIDTEDLDMLKKLNYRWHSKWILKQDTYYIKTTYGYHDDSGKYKQKPLYLHRLIVKVEEDYIIDHINNNPLDNRKENLRAVTKDENNLNRRGARANSKSGHRNVVWSSWEKKWIVTLQVDGKRVAFGKFNEDELGLAAKLADEKRLEIYGETFANT